MTGYHFHPEAEIDLNQIWDYIADDNVSAADRVLADIHRAVMHGHRSPRVMAAIMRSRENRPPGV
jgi:plasmid stabilization system protein ParE